MSSWLVWTLLSVRSSYPSWNAYAKDSAAMIVAGYHRRMAGI